MKKERLKTCLLIVLIISSVILTGKIWFDEKLWPEGYNFFALITDKFLPGETKVVSSLTKETISFPKNLIVTNVEKRSVYASGSKPFADMVPDVKSALCMALESTDAIPATEQEWAVALKTRSIHVVYPVAYDSKLFLNILGSYHTQGESIPVREFIITSGDMVSSNVNVYIRNYDTAAITKATVAMDKLRLDSMIDTYAAESIGDLAYSSELNFDKSGGGDQQKVVIDSSVLLQLNKQFNHMVEEINPVYEDDFNPDVVDSLLKKFNYNASGARKYTERDNSVVYVENYSSLKIHPNGLVEYKAIDDTKGIDLGSGNDFYQGLLGCVDFVNLMWGEVFPSEPLNINISSDVIDTKSNSFRLTMDYFADGAQINTDLPQTTSHNVMNHAVEIQVVGGKIVSYRQVLAFYSPADEFTDGMSTIEALDKLMAGGNMQGQVIRDLYPVHISDGTSYRKPAWAARTANNDNVVIN